MKINILLADGRKLFREGISLLLEQHEDLRVVAETGAAAEVPRLLRALRVDVAIVNLAPPSNEGVEAVRAILAAKKDVRVLALTLSPSVEFVHDLIDAGASGCLTKESAGSELVLAVRRVMQGELYLSPDLVERVVMRSIRPSSTPLAAREREVLQSIAAGRTTKEIALSLCVSSKTIETHRRRIMEKLNRHSVAELTKYAVLEGLTPLETQS